MKISQLANLFRPGASLLLQKKIFKKNRELIRAQRTRELLGFTILEPG